MEIFLFSIHAFNGLKNNIFTLSQVIATILGYRHFLKVEIAAWSPPFFSEKRKVFDRKTGKMFPMNAKKY